MLGDDEAQAHPAEDDHQGGGGDGPDDHPRLLHQPVAVGEIGRGAGDDVGHVYPPRQLSASSPDARSTTPQRVPWTPSMTHPAKALAQRAGLRADRILSQMQPGWWMGMTAVEVAPPARLRPRPASPAGRPGLDRDRGARQGRGTPKNTPSRRCASSRRPSPGTWRLSSRRCPRRKRRRRGLRSRGRRRGGRRTRRRPCAPRTPGRR